MNFKKYLLSLVLCTVLMPFMAKAQWTGINNAEPTPAQIQLNSSNITKTTFKVDVDGFLKKLVNTPKGEAFVIDVENGSRILEKGAPDLPKITTSLIIPDKNAMDVKVIGSDYVEFTNMEIAPSKGSFSRAIDPETVPYTYSKVYQKNGFFPSKFVELGDAYIVRDYRGIVANIYPYQYNPVTKTLRVYTSIQVEVYKTSRIGENEIAARKSFDKVEREYNNIYAHHFLNFNSTRYTPLEEDGAMLIISHDAFMDAMQPLVDWKNKIGRPTEIVDVATIGNTASAIKAYIADYYANNNLAYVLLVGDDAQVTASSTSAGDSDSEYAYLAGNDHYHEVFVGRFSAETEAHVETQVQRTLEYEQADFANMDWLNKNIGIASDQGPGDDNEYDYEHIRNIHVVLEGFTYTASAELFDGSQGGNDQPGNPSASMVGIEINTGASLINYVGHGSDNSWSTSGFSNSDVNGLTNVGKLPFIWSVACVNGNFVGQTCFAEAWLRAEDGSGNPTGAVAMYASTINQDWDPPMEGQDEMNFILTETYASNIKRTYGGISINGCFSMIDEYVSSTGNDMSDTWTIFGDPSLMVRTDVATEFASISYPDAIVVGTTEITVNSAVEGATVCISYDNEIVGVGIVDGGSATVPVPGITPGQILDIVVTGFNKIPHISTVTVIAPTGPYVVFDEFSISGGQNINYGQTADIDITLQNVGPDQASAVTATLTTSDPYVTSLSNNENINFGDIAGNNGTASSSSNFTITVSDTIPDNYTIAFELVASDNNSNTWNSTFNVTAHAPVMTIGELEIANDDDGNGRLDPGETADLIIYVTNNGNAECMNLDVELTGDNVFFTVSNPLQFLDPIAVGATVPVTFEVSAGSACTNGTLVNLVFALEDARTITSNKSITIGQSPIVVIGEGTSESEYYPFYTYYENNKSQMLYLGSEIGAGEVQLQELAFDFLAIGEITELSNLEIKFKETTLTSLGNSYEDMSSATTVYSGNFTMPSSTGWNSFDITDYDFDASNNLLIEITWGDNGDWGNSYCKVACSEYSDVLVTYGYADSETPPNYDGNSSTRPNITLHLAGEEPQETFEVTFTVLDDETNNPIPDAKIMVGSLTKPVDASGLVMFELAAAEYNYSASAVNYRTLNDVVTVDGVETVTVLLENNEGISDIDANAYEVYPNPAKDLVKIYAPETIKFVKLVSIGGKLIDKYDVNSSECEVELNDVESGIYLLQITTSDNVITKKIQIIK